MIANGRRWRLSHLLEWLSQAVARTFGKESSWSSKNRIFTPWENGVWGGVRGTGRDLGGAPTKRSEEL